ncbi:hypothetical protein JCM10450v2_002467 [Rhodotorula kratochvilovae]
MSADIWDEGWQDMPVLRSAELDAPKSLFDADAAEPDDQADGADPKRRNPRRTMPAPSRLPDAPVASGYATMAGGATTGNATGRVVEAGEAGATVGLREKGDMEEMDYTRLELDDDPDEDEISMRTQYLFNEETSMTPLSQMQQTKTLLTEGQRIAYVGLCRLVAREMVQALALAAKGAKELEPAREGCQNWANKIMGRLYRHMEVDSAEQRMIEQLAEHGVTAEDLVPSLVATYTIDNPEYDAEAAELAAQEGDIALESEVGRDAEQKKRGRDEQARRERAEADEARATSQDLEERLGDMALGTEGEESEDLGYVRREVRKIERRASEAVLREPPSGSPRSTHPPQSPETPTKCGRSMFDAFDDGGDIGSALDSPPARSLADSPIPAHPDYAPAEASADPPHPPSSDDEPTTPRATSPSLPAYDEVEPKTRHPDNFLDPLPSSLPGVSKTLTHLDKTVTLDIRWTILCDLFLALIADSVYDARSRVLLGKMAEKLGLEWMDVVRFERRLTEALEIQEAVKEKKHDEVLEGRRLKDKQKRYLLMGAATVGGGLVIGLSAGLLAPFIGAGLGAALATVGVSGTSGFLAGAGGAAIISSGATLTGATIGGKAMARRTRHVKTFDILPVHNNKRLNVFLTVSGFMNGIRDDVRLPFSTIDPVMGDVLSVLWEPEMMGDTGRALNILTSEVLTQAGQQVLAATVMTALMSALQWPMMLTKLSYLIDNPWSNALDRAVQAGAVLADILLNRRLGVRPVSLVGFSLGARVIFFALVELAKRKAFGVVQEVYLFGATVTASRKVWREVRGIVSGRFVNGFAMNDWVLGYLFRATTGGLQTVAGLRPIELVPDLENVDVTHLLDGHLSYRPRMPKLLAYVGFKTTGDHFDEPDVDPDAPEREVLTKEEEEARRLKRERKGLGIFRRKKATDSQPMSRQPSGDEYDLPPRLSASSSTTSLAKPGSGPVSATGGRSSSSLSLATTASGSEADEDEKAAVRAGEAPSLAETPAATPPAVDEHDPTSFNIDKLRAEVAQLPKPAPERAASLPADELPTLPTPRSSASESFGSDIARAPSAPPHAEPPQTDLTHLDQSLDPRELLRRQWNGDAASAGASSIPSLAPPLESAWGGSSLTLPDDHYASTSTFSFPSLPSISTSSADTPSFTFAGANGFDHAADDITPTHDRQAFSFGAPGASLDDAASFTFGGDDGSFTPWGAPPAGSAPPKQRDDAEGGAVWGTGGSKANESTSTLATQNPW